MSNLQKDLETLMSLDVPPIANRARGLTEQEQELIDAAIHYVKIAKNPSLSEFIPENGRHKIGWRSPWAELVDAVNALQD